MAIIEQIGTTLIRHDPSYVNKNKEHPIFLKARTFYMNQQWHEAKCEYETLLSLNPNSASYHNSYACILSRFNNDVVNNSSIAQHHMAIAVKLSPQDMQFRLTNIQFLMDLKQFETAHQEFKKAFKYIFANNAFDMRQRKCDALHLYARFLYNFGQNQEAGKFIRYEIELQRKFGYEITLQSHLSLLNSHLRCENVPEARKVLQQIKEKHCTRSGWEAFHTRTTDPTPWIRQFGELALLVQDYETAYGLLFRAYKTAKQFKTLCIKLRIMTDLMECCIELNKSIEFQLVDDELCELMRSDPKIIEFPDNANIREYCIFMRNCKLIKMAGKQNAIEAVEQLEAARREIEQHNPNMLNRIPPVHFYLGLAYKNLEKYVHNSTRCRQKRKEVLFLAAHLERRETIFCWEFALVLWSENEIYICKKYAKCSWKRCKQIKCIAAGYPILIKKLQKAIKTFKCGYCGMNKYKDSKDKTDKLKACKGCHKMYYCNTKCQKEHWRESHRKTCNKSWIRLKMKMFKPTKIVNEFVSFEQLKKDYQL
eukprot:31183_1